MKKIFIIFAAMAAVLSSCQKSELESVSANEIKDIVLNISVSNPGANDSKALVKTGWTNGDQIKIWYDSNTGETPDLVIKYDGDKDNWNKDEKAPVSGKQPFSGDNRYIKAVYNNFVIVSSRDEYNYTDNTLSFSIKNWKFLTEIQVVVKGIPYYYDAIYNLYCDKFTPVSRAGFTVGTGDITAATAAKGGAARGISNADGVAFVFATAEYSSSDTEKKDFTFTLKDDITGSEVTKTFKINTVIKAMDGKKSINALMININKFAATIGSAKRTGDIDVNWVQLWAGGPKFAEYNVGVTDGKAESYGGYYTWGGSCENGIGNPWNDDHNTTNTGTGDLTGTDDTATALWGENWRMPTRAELEALINPTNCDVAWTNNYNGTGIKGRICTGKGAYASNSVFLPTAGYCGSYGVNDQGNGGNYWSSTPEGSDSAYGLHFDWGEHYVSEGNRSIGYSVRAVLAE